jgi:hypothetical protein
MFRRLPLLEIAIELYSGSLTINLVLPPGTVFADLKKWIWAAVLAEILARIWSFLVLTELHQYAHRLLSAMQLMERNMTHGPSAHHHQLIQWLRKTLILELSHLLAW